MNIVIFTHPRLLGSRSMPKYAKMIAEGMERRNHRVEIWTAREYFSKISSTPFLKKWLGYLDQFMLFPMEVRKKLRNCPGNTLFVFSDHALSPWAELVADKPLVIHCHDFMAQRSAMGEIPENKVGFTGKIYQRLIRKGYRKGNNFISISEHTQRDLHRFLKGSPEVSKVVYNGLNQQFKPGDKRIARRTMEQEIGVDLSSGFILHVGGNQFYKNRKGVIRIYDAWRQSGEQQLPLLLVGANPPKDLREERNRSGFGTDIHFLTDIPDRLLQVAYQAAEVLLFPSLEEGFGWPIAEAMASGCPVITTDSPPMNEVGSNSCFYISPVPKSRRSLHKWSKESALVLDKVLRLSQEERQKLVASGIKNAARFDTERAIAQMEHIYKSVLTKTTV